MDFYFSHQGREFHVWRQPSYERQKQRGSGVILEKEKAILYEEGQKIQALNKTVKELKGKPAELINRGKKRE